MKGKGARERRVLAGLTGLWLAAAALCVGTLAIPELFGQVASMLTLPELPLPPLEVPSAHRPTAWDVSPQRFVLIRSGFVSAAPREDRDVEFPDRSGLEVFHEGVRWDPDSQAPGPVRDHWAPPQFRGPEDYEVG